MFVLSFAAQINGVDVSDARHDQAVALLTSSTHEVTLVVYREHLIGQVGEAPPVQHQQELTEPQIVLQTGPVLAAEPTPQSTPASLPTATIDSLPSRSPPGGDKTVTITTTQSSVSPQPGRTISQQSSIERSSFVDQFNAIGSRKPEPPPRTVVSQSLTTGEVNHEDSVHSQTDESPFPIEVS